MNTHITDKLLDQCINLVYNDKIKQRLVDPVYKYVKYKIIIFYILLVVTLLVILITNLVIIYYIFKLIHIRPTY